jgi:hypothetical protein
MELLEIELEKRYAANDQAMFERWLVMTKGITIGLRYEMYALGILFRRRLYLLSFVLISSSFSVAYMFLLPSLPFGTVALFAIKFITPLQIAFSLVFGVLLGLVITLNIYSYKIRTTSMKGLTLGSIISSLVNGLCCTPFVPTIVTMTGASTPVIYSISPSIQAFFEFNYPYFYALSSLLLLISVHLLSRNIACCER